MRLASFEPVIDNIRLQKFASQSIIATYCLLLKEYATLSDPLLHCITRMFYRISVKQTFDALFFQVLAQHDSLIIMR
jgi:hypothetical protein